MAEIVNALASKGSPDKMPRELMFSQGDRGFILSESSGNYGSIGRGRLWAFTSIKEVADFLLLQYDPDDL